MLGKFVEPARFIMPHKARVRLRQPEKTPCGN
jgi:hypothetical protein